MPRIIIAEDEASLRNIVSEMLEDRGFQVLQAENGAKALELLQENPGTALLLSDIRMPVMSGYELVEASIKLRPELKILLMTGYAAELPPPATLHAREIRTMLKPFDLDELGDLVSDMLARP